MSCDAVLRVLRDYLDRELDVARAEKVERHLATCPACDARARAELDLKQVIRSRVRAGPAPAGLSGQILRRLRREDAGSSRTARRRLVLAGALGVLAITVCVLPWNRSDPSRLITELIDDHIRYLVSADPAAAGTDEPEAAQRWLEGQLSLAVPVPRFDRGGPRLLGARRCSVLDRQVALLFYESGGERLSLFVMDDRGLDLAGMERVDVAAADGVMESYKGYHIVGWKHSGLLFALVGRGAREDLIDIASAALKP